MFLPSFELLRPTSIDEALESLALYEDEVAIYMGGTELLLLMKMGLAEPSYLLDCKRISELRGLEVTDHRLRIGSAMTHREVERSAAVREALPELCQLERMVGNIRVRSAGTLGGNLCFADPNSDPAALLLALGATFSCVSAEGWRTIPAEEFMLAPYETVLGESELLVAADIPLPGADTAVAYERIAFRERPVLSVAVVRQGDTFRVVAAGAGRVAARFPDVEARLPATTESEIDDAAHQLMEQMDPTEDLDGSREYKRHLGGVVFRRAIARTLSA